MGLNPEFNAGDIDKAFEKFEKDADSKIMRMFQYVGEDFVNRARTGGTYRDITGNLRSSIGYTIGLDGRIKDKSFPGEKSEGKSAGEELAQEVTRESKGYVLVVTAGMNYAGKVESRGRQVLSAFTNGSASLLKKLFGALK